MDTPERGDPRAIDLGTLLTVLQAAEWANVSVSTIRRRMEDGDLLSEISRERGRDVQRIRWVDLCDLYPHILASAGGPTTDSAVPETQQSSPEQTGPAHPPVEGDPLDIPIGSEAPVGAVVERGLQMSVQTLTEQRNDLREQCYDLRIRLSAAEKERQASVGALLQAQKQVLSSDQGGWVADPGPIWKRPRVWSLVAAAGLLLWIMSGMFDRLKSDIAEEQGRWSEDLAADTEQRLQFQSQRLDGERRAMQDQLVRLNEHNEQQRLAIRTKLDQDQGDRKQLWQQVEALGEDYSQTQQMVQEALNSEDQRRRQWATEQEASATEHWTQLRTDSMVALRSELALQGDRNMKQQESLAASWRLREQRALKESERLASTVEGLVARVETSERENDVLSTRLKGSQAKNAAFRRNQVTDVMRGLGHWACRFALWQKPAGR